MRLIRGTPVHRINLRARINHTNRSGGPAPSAGDGHARGELRVPWLGGLGYGP